MNRSDYYEGLKELSNEVRETHGITTRNISLALLRRVYKTEGITLDYWHGPLKKVRAAYLLDDEGQPHVMLNAAIYPKEPKIFSLSHELKHHYKDQEIIREKGILGCQDIASWERGSAIEIGAEIFAAELIYPEQEFKDFADQMGLTKEHCTVEQVIQFKRECGAFISYAFIVNRLEWFKVIPKGYFKGVHFVKLEEQLYGVPFYKQRYRRGAKTNLST